MPEKDLPCDIMIAVYLGPQETDDPAQRAPQVEIHIQPLALYAASVAGIFVPARIGHVVAPLTKMTPPILMLFVMGALSIPVPNGDPPCAVFLGHCLFTMWAAMGSVGVE